MHPQAEGEGHAGAGKHLGNLGGGDQTQARPAAVGGHQEAAKPGVGSEAVDLDRRSAFSFPIGSGGDHVIACELLHGLHDVAFRWGQLHVHDFKL